MHEILEKIKIGINVVIFLLRTDRGMQASEVCGECLILLNNLNCGIDDLDVIEVKFNAYYAISGYTNAARFTSRLIGMLHNAVILMRELREKYQEKSRFAEAKKLFERAVAIMKTFVYKRKGAVANKYLGDKFRSLGEYQKAKEYYERALAIATEIGETKSEGRLYGNLGSVFQSLGEYQKAKEYHEKALAIATEIGDRKGEGASYRKLGTVFESLGEYQKAKECHKKAIAIAAEIGDKNGEGTSYRCLGAVFQSLGEYQKAKEYHEKALAILTEIGDKDKEGACYGNLGGVFQSLGEYQKAEEYHEKALAIATEIGDRKGEGTSYGNLGSVFRSLGEYQKAKEYHEKALAIATEIGDRKGEGASYRKLGTVFESLGEYQKAKEYHEKAIAIAAEIGDKKGEGTSYRCLGAVFQSLGEYRKAKEYHENALAIAVEIGDREGEGRGYINLGAVFLSLRKNKQAKEHFDKALSISTESGNRNCEGECHAGLARFFYSLHDYQKATEHDVKALAISKNIGDRKSQGRTYLHFGHVSLSLGNYSESEKFFEKARLIGNKIGDIMTDFESLLGITLLKIPQSELEKAMLYLSQCTKKYEEMRSLLAGNDDLKTSLLEGRGNFPYKLFSQLLCVTGRHRDALYVEELRRARGLAELMGDKLSVESHISTDSTSWFGIEKIVNKENSCDVLYISYCERHVHLWVLKANGDIKYRVSPEMEIDTLIAVSVCEVEEIFKRSASSFGVRMNENCEDRSLDDDTPMPHEESQATVRVDQTKAKAQTQRILQLCFEQIITPVQDLLTEPEIIIVPESCSYRVPFAALRDETAGKYLAETHRIRIVPSLTTLGLIQECPADYHSQTGALVVGDPMAVEVQYKGRTLQLKPLPCARKEAEMVGRLLGVQPLLGEHATKKAVLQAIHSVSLLHLAAHGNADRGEIALSPNCALNSIPKEEDYLLKMSDIAKVRLRAKLVVLSCCHSGRGTFKKEGVIGIARAFLASGARSVLVASWAIQDEATEELMNHFYEHLAAGESASESLHQAIKWLRSKGFTEPCQWAPFVLMGDNVTFDLKKLRKEELTDDENDADKRQSSN
ncbi:hypothetical protein pdam_00002395 [Pocillopora damicornis]|uniref:CHAT domain-containing protein n=1 Tax=Pocillopora damicornis TaxID=46731 RepID=A0A3M6USD0_POCDA|nr:tetratricopeptide repeat protein 28-like [Pocillopora damicornis]RMX56576.1 hypothetical protein pdam_00002395 [Pocillopora damicornis]